MKLWLPRASAFRLRVLTILGCLLALAPAGAPGNARAQDLLIGTGSANGVYFHVGRSLCRMVESAGLGLTCKPLETDGSLFNLTNLHSGAIEIGIVQSDWQYNAVRKEGNFQFVDEDMSELRALFSLHSEAFTVVARKDAGIESFDDLKGKRVNIGNPGSGQRATMEVVMAAKGWSSNDFEVAQELSAAEQVLALCHNRIQALVYMVGHPNPSIGKALGLCGARFVDVGGAAIEELVETRPYFSWTRIPEDVYPASPEGARTFGVTATVMSSADVDAELVYGLVRAVFEGLGKFKGYHAAFASLDPERMVSDGITATLHEGAIRYYREAGLIED